MNNELKSKLELYYPGIYSAEDKKLLDSLQKQFDAINNRGEIDIDALVGGRLDPGTSGVLPFIQTVNETDMDRFARNFDPDNPLFHSKEYASQTWFSDIIAYPTYPCPQMLLTPMPAGLRDYMLVNGLSHSNTLHRPLYKGDTLYTVVDHREVTDITPAEGCVFRTFAIYATGRIFNQKGELVLDGWSRVKESLARYADPALRGSDPSYWYIPENYYDRPKHYYTDKDWELIKGIWAGETVRGKEPLYWEDVNIGDMPAPIAEGPATALDMIKYMGWMEFGQPPLKKKMSDPRMSKLLERDANDGMYYSCSGAGHFQEGRVQGRRATFYNNVPRDFAARMLMNWMGEQGWIKTIKWGLMTVILGYEDMLPPHPDFPSYLRKVPALSGREVDAHGLEGDLSIMKAYVCDKYKNGDENLVDLVWWAETIDGEIYEEGYATVMLPGKA